MRRKPASGDFARGAQLRLAVTNRITYKGGIEIGSEMAGLGEYQPDGSPEHEVASMCVGRRAVRSIVAGLVTLLAGCASQAPQRPATPPLQPVVGEAQTAIAERTYLFVAVYQFEWEGHRYALGNASDPQQRDTYSELVFIDGGFVCARERPMATLTDLDSELTQWERAAEPGGLAYLAEQLRSACASATVDAPQRSSQGTELTESSSSPVRGESGRHDGSRSDAELAAAIAANSLQLSIANPALLIVVPLALLAIGISNIDEAMAAKAARQLDSKWRSANSVEDVMKLLGKPVVEFSLPNVGTKVLAYRLDEVHPYFVGLSGGKPIWFHNEYPWLHELAQQAIQEGKKQ